jgi:hypothetical protein
MSVAVMVYARGFRVASPSQDHPIKKLQVRAHVVVR